MGNGAMPCSRATRGEGPDLVRPARGHGSDVRAVPASLNMDARRLAPLSPLENQVEVLAPMRSVILRRLPTTRDPVRRDVGDEPLEHVGVLATQGPLGGVKRHGVGAADAPLVVVKGGVGVVRVTRPNTKIISLVAGPTSPCIVQRKTTKASSSHWTDAEPGTSCSVGSRNHAFRIVVCQEPIKTSNCSMASLRITTSSASTSAAPGSTTDRSNEPHAPGLSTHDHAAIRAVLLTGRTRASTCLGSRRRTSAPRCWLDCSPMHPMVGQQKFFGGYGPLLLGWYFHSRASMAEGH